MNCYKLYFDQKYIALSRLVLFQKGIIKIGSLVQIQCILL